MRRGIVATLLFLVMVPAARADLTWTATQIISTDEQNGSGPQVAVDANGGAVVVWTESDNGVDRVRVATRTRGGFLGPPAFLSPAGVAAGGARVVVAADGTAVVAWNQDRPGADPTGIYTSVRPPGGTFSEPTQETINPNHEDLRKLAMDPSGRTVMLSERDDSAKGVSLLYRTRPPGGTFTGTNNIWDGGALNPTPNSKAILYGTDVAFDAAGNAAIGWTDNPSAVNGDLSPNELRVMQLNANGTTVAPQVVAPRVSGQYINGPSVFINATRTGVLWTRNLGADGVRAQMSFRAGLAGGAFTEPYTFGSGETQWGAIGDDSSGAAVATVSRFPPSGEERSEVYFPPGKLDFNGSKPLPAGIFGTATEFDAAGRGGAQFSSLAGDEVFFAQREPGIDPVYSAPFDLGPYDFDRDVAVGPDGTAANVWVVTQDGNDRVVARFGDLPKEEPAPEPGQPAPAPSPVPTPPPPPPAPVPSAIQLVNKPARGEASVLTVAVSGNANRVEWDTGKEKGRVGTVVGGVLQRSLRTRLTGPTTVTVRVSGPGGTQTFSRAISGPSNATDDNAKEIYRGQPPNDDPVSAVGTEDVLTGRSSGCGPVTVYSGALTIAGCMRPIGGISDIPSGERGVLDALNIAYGLLTNSATLLNRVTELVDGYAISGVATVNGRWPVSPASGASLVAYPEAGVLTSSNAFVRVAGQPLRSYFPGFKLQLTTKSGVADLGLAERPASFPQLGGFQFTGDFSVALGTTNATIQTELKLPDFARRNGVNVYQPVKIPATADALSGTSAPTIGPMDINFGLISVKDLTATFDPGSNQWVGGMRACLLGPGCLNFRPPQGAIRLQNDQLVYARTGESFGNPGLALSPGVFLESIGAGFGLNPSRIFGGGRISLGSIVKLDGNEVFAFPSAQAPYRLQRGEVGNAFPPNLYDLDFTRPVIAAGADVLLALPVLGETKLANGYMLYEAPGYVTVGGGAGVDVLGIFSVNGVLSGEYNLANQRSNVHGDTSACLIAVDDDLCARSVVNISRGPGVEGGAGACATLGPVSVGGGVLWASPGTPIIWPLDGCKWSTFKLEVRTRRQTGPITSLTVNVGKQAKAIRLDGAGDSPLVRVTGPQSLELSGQRLAYTPDGAARIIRADAGDAHFTTVGLQKPGTWKIDVLPGSAAVTKSSQALDPLDAKVSGRVVRGRGDKRVLRYTVRKRPAQSVSFYDQSASGARKLIGTTRGGRGRITFTPAPDRGRHKVVAAFALDGIAAEQRDVTSFQPPSPVLPAPRGLRVRRKGTTVRVAWRRVRGAARYELSLLAGRQRFATTRKRSATFKKVAKTAGGSVTVRAVASLRESPVSKAKVRRAAKRKRGGLKRCTVKKKKFRCH